MARRRQEHGSLMERRDGGAAQYQARCFATRAHVEHRRGEVLRARQAFAHGEARTLAAAAQARRACILTSRLAANSRVYRYEGPFSRTQDGRAYGVATLR